MNQNRTILPGWEFVRPIGEGSFAEVYEIKRTDIFGNEEKSALKVITIPASAAEINSYREDGYDDASITTVFKNQVEEISKEFVLMNKLKGYTNIVSYEDNMVIPHDNGIGWDILIRMELLESLPNYMSKHFDFGTIDESIVLRIAKDMCRALELCEKHQIIHRDIKPSNIFVNKTGDFKLGDFGVAKTSDHTTRGAKTGTYAYMAPEVFNNKPYGARADIYSLGMVLYWLLNERRGPFEPLPPEIPRPSQKNRAMERRMNGEELPAPAHGSEALKAVVLKACAFDPNDRYRSASEMLQALNGIVVDDERESIPNPVGEDVSVHTPEQEDVMPIDETVGPFSEVAPVMTEKSVIEGTVGPFDGNPNMDTKTWGEGTVGPFDGVLSDDTNGETVIPKPEPEPKPQKRKWPVFAAVATVLAVVIGVCAMFGLGNQGESSSVENNLDVTNLTNSSMNVFRLTNMAESYSRTNIRTAYEDNGKIVVDMGENSDILKQTFLIRHSSGASCSADKFNLLFEGSLLIITPKKELPYGIYNFVFIMDGGEDWVQIRYTETDDEWCQSNASGFPEGSKEYLTHKLTGVKMEKFISQNSNLPDDFYEGGLLMQSFDGKTETYYAYLNENSNQYLAIDDKGNWYWTTELIDDCWWFW